MMFAAALTFLFANAVTIEAVSTGLTKDTPVEFLLTGPLSDHDYESLFTTTESIREIVEKFQKAGLPIGRPISVSDCRFWPVGTKVSIEPPINSFIRDIRENRLPSPVYTGGERDAKGEPVAETNMPMAVFALYNLPQSLFQFNDCLDQSPTYGRFHAARDFSKGEKVSLIFTWDGERPIEYTARFIPGHARETLLEMKNRAEEGELDVLPDFSPELTVREAGEIARALQGIDSVRVRINGFTEDQFFYHAFLPLEKWRDRKERLTQPYEIRLKDADQPVLTVIDEDWSDVKAMEPKLIVREDVAFSELAERDDAVDTCFIYASSETKLSSLYPVRAMLPKRIRNWYIYTE